jgi:hypothetical protein
MNNEQSTRARLNISEAQPHALWDVRPFYRVFNLVNGGGQIESDLFEEIV